jgi:long-subunit fatty acid transport protein
MSNLINPTLASLAANTLLGLFCMAALCAIVACGALAGKTVVSYWVTAREMSRDNEGRQVKHDTIMLQARAAAMLAETQHQLVHTRIKEKKDPLDIAKEIKSMNAN